MSEHLLFLQAAGSDYIRAHELVVAVTEAIRGPHEEQANGESRNGKHHNSSKTNGSARKGPAPNPQRIVERLERAGWTGPEGLLVALAVHATVASPVSGVDVDWIASTAARIGNADLLRETAGVVFAFNTINRIADARRVRLEYRFLRELKPIRGWVERRLSSLTGLAYDLSYKHQPRRSSAELLDRLGLLFERLGAPAVPAVFDWLSRSPVVLEGVLEMFEANVTSAGVGFDFWKEAAAIAVASRGMADSGLTAAVDQWLSHSSLPDAHTLRSTAAPTGVAPDVGLASARRRYLWQVANAAHTICDEQLREIAAHGVEDAHLLDLTLATALFSALAIIEPIGAAVAPLPVAGGQAIQPARVHEGQVSLARDRNLQYEPTA